MKASCVVLTCQRHHNLPKIIDGLLATPEIAEVVVWNNNHQQGEALVSDLVSRFRSDPVHIYSDKDKRNLYTWGRYKAAKSAQCGIVCTQDDDVLVSPFKWRTLLERFEADKQERLCCYLDPGHYRHGVTCGKYKHAYQHGDESRAAWETLVGWGSVFLRDWVHDAFREFFSIHPADELSCRKADRIFTTMLDREHTALTCQIEHLSGAASDNALYRMSDHWKANAEAVSRVLWVLKSRP